MTPATKFGSAVNHRSGSAWQYVKPCAPLRSWIRACGVAGLWLAALSSLVRCQEPRWEVAQEVPLGVPCIAFTSAMQIVPTTARELNVALAPQSETRPIGTALALNPDGGPELAIGADDHTIRIVDASSGEELHCLYGHTDWVRTICWEPAPIGLVSSGYDGKVMRWHFDGEQWRGTVMAELPSAVLRLVARPHTNQLLVSGRTPEVHLLDANSGRFTQTVKLDCLDIFAVAVDPLGRYLVTGDRSGVIAVWDLEKAMPVWKSQEHKRRVRDIVFSESGQMFYSTAEDGYVIAWNIAANSPVWRSNRISARLMCLTRISEQLLVAGGADNAIHLFDAANKTEIAQLRGHLGSVVGLVNRGDVLVSSSFDTNIRVWQGTNEILRDRERWTRPVSRTETVDEEIR